MKVMNLVKSKQRDKFYRLLWKLKVIGKIQPNNHKDFFLKKDFPKDIVSVCNWNCRQILLKSVPKIKQSFIKTLAP